MSDRALTILMSQLVLIAWLACDLWWHRSWDGALGIQLALWALLASGAGALLAWRPVRFSTPVILVGAPCLWLVMIGITGWPEVGGAWRLLGFLLAVVASSYLAPRIPCPAR
jgi:hypothetical protein